MNFNKMKDPVATGRIYSANPRGGSGKIVFNNKDFGVVSIKTREIREMNKVPQLVIFTGNIGCGKSALAAKMAKDLNCVVINGDAITTMVQGGDYSAYDPKKKPICHAIEKAGIETALENGRGDLADLVVLRLRKLADRIEKNCVKGKNGHHAKTQE